MQNGIITRLFYSNGTPSNLFNYFHSVTTIGVEHPLDIANALEFTDTCNGAWGIAKYKITISINGTGEKYVFYFNNLDSKYGKSNWQGRNRYSNDWTIRYDESLDMNSRVTIQE